MCSTVKRKAATGAERSDIAATRSYLEALVAASAAVAAPGAAQDVLAKVRVALEESVW